MTFDAAAVDVPDDRSVPQRFSVVDLTTFAGESVGIRWVRTNLLPHPITV